MMGFRQRMLVTGMVVLGMVLVLPFHVFAATTMFKHSFPPDVFITEIQTSSEIGAGGEFIELYNNTDADIDLSGLSRNPKDIWQLQYFSASKLPILLAGTNWTGAYRTINLTGVIPAHDYYVLAGTGYNPANITPDQAYGSTMADDGGALQLIDSTTSGSNTTITIHDQTAWSTDTKLPTNPLLFTPPGANGSLQRVPDDDNQYVSDTGELSEFTTDKRISPGNAWTPLVTQPVDNDTDPVDGNAGLPGKGAVGGPAGPIITELLPNPASPQTDEQDEFIELYNPDAAAFDLTGYTLETGSSTKHSFTFTSGSVLAGESYRAFYSADTGLSLSNSGGQARLLDADGQTVSESDSYGTAADGEAWALGQDGTWSWTLTPTPGASNVADPPAGKVSVVKATSKKKAAAKTKAKLTVKKAKKTKAAKKKRTKKAAPKVNLASSTVTPVAPIHPQVLAAVGVLAVGYGLYEYRQDIANKFYQFRSDRMARRKARR